MSTIGRHLTRVQLLLVLLCISMLLATGALTAVLLYLYWDYERTVGKPSLLVLAGVNFLCSISYLLILFLNPKSNVVFLLTSPNLLMIGAAIWYNTVFIQRVFALWHYIQENVDVMAARYHQHLNTNVFVIHGALLLGTAFITGIATGLTLFAGTSTAANGDIEDQQSSLGLRHNLNGGFVPMDCEHANVVMKPSAMTLTPDMDIMQHSTKNWMNEHLTVYPGSEVVSTPSVIKHPLTTLKPHPSEFNNRSISSSSNNSKFRSGSLNNSSSRGIIDKLQRKISKNQPPSQKCKLPSHTKEEIDACYVTRLSTISDTSKTALTLLHQSFRMVEGKSLKSLFHNGNMQNKGIDQESFYDTSVARTEDAVEPYDSVLIPPCLKYEDIPCCDNLDVLSEHNLENILSVPEIASLQESRHPMARVISLQDWNENKDQILEADRRNHSRSMPLLYSHDSVSEVGVPSSQDPEEVASELGLPKSFAGAELDGQNGASKLIVTTLQSLSPMEAEGDVAVSILETALHNYKEGDDLIAQGLALPDRSSRPNTSCLSLVGTHSPSKSIYSFSSLRSPSQKSNIITSQSIHSRNNSQYSGLFTPLNPLVISSTQSSPTKNYRLRKRLSHKFSRSVFNFKWDSKEVTDEVLMNQQGNVIDLSYVHHLQNKHSASRSMHTLVSSHIRSSSSPQAIELNFENQQPAELNTRTKATSPIRAAKVLVSGNRRFTNEDGHSYATRYS
ncbi:Irc8p Ecym_6302 [Eremothecium cymbalariae DBVPG|uniref:Uncharacterized protein n=1 Tax=Eremothecium cymbalariae (strain CBS 270.75 / DBVPG 7215 / KCTC 17166 / NRRL Y-17582) TaxID=931890 RepID=G8JUA2_ERECY|nr:hypothetical protein Ecym_6302 [Eremothecium cymbalariae DBVPG\